MGEIRSYGHGKKNDPDLPSKKKLPHDRLRSCLKKLWDKLESLKKCSDPRPNTLKRSYKWPPTHFCACSESKHRSYKILIPLKDSRLFKTNSRLFQDSENYAISK